MRRVAPRPAEAVIIGFTGQDVVVERAKVACRRDHAIRVVVSDCCLTSLGGYAAADLIPCPNAPGRAVEGIVVCDAADKPIGVFCVYSSACEIVELCVNSVSQSICHLCGKCEC